MRANDHGYVRVMQNYQRDYEHRRVWIAAHGPIPPGLKIHHLNNDPADNRIENLALVTQSEHTRAHQRCYDENGSKRCTICLRFKPQGEFSHGRNNTIQGPCKKCKAAYNRRYRASSRRSQRRSSQP